MVLHCFGRLRGFVQSNHLYFFTFFKIEKQKTNIESKSDSINQVWSQFCFLPDKILVWVLTKSITKHLPIGYSIAQGAKATIGTVTIAIIFAIALAVNLSIKAFCWLKCYLTATGAKTTVTVAVFLLKHVANVNYSKTLLVALFTFPLFKHPRRS